MSGSNSATLTGLLSQHAAQQPHAIFLEDSLGNLTWAQVWNSALSLAAGLRQCGVGPGDRLLIALDNRREFLQIWFAAAILGAVEVPLDPRAGQAHARHVTTHAEPSLAFLGPETEAVSAIVDSLGASAVVAVGDVDLGTEAVRLQDLVGDPMTVTPVDAAPGALGAVMYTSGTSGPPKGVMIPLGQHVESGRQAVAAASITDQDRIVVCLPLHHNMAQGYGVLPALVAGATVHLLPRFDRRTFWQEVAASRASVFPFVGGILHLLLGNPPSPAGRDHALRVAYGVPVPGGIHERFERRFGVTVIHGYGSTEATIPVWQDPADRVVGSAGRAVPGYAVECRDDTGRPVSTGQVGEIHVRSAERDRFFLGYFRDPAATSRVMHEGWFSTGDLGRFDKAGNLWFTGRITDSIRRFGEFIDPEEIEERASAHLGVAAAAAFGVRSPVAEQEIMLAVVVHEASSFDPRALRDWLAERLPRRSLPRFIEVLPELPMTSTGKVAKFKLRDRGVQATTHDFRLEGATSD